LDCLVERQYFANVDQPAIGYLVFGGGELSLQQRQPADAPIRNIGYPKFRRDVLALLE
jgi:hypothetical protein